MYRILLDWYSITYYIYRCHSILAVRLIWFYHVALFAFLSGCLCALHPCDDHAVLSKSPRPSSPAN